MKYKYIAVDENGEINAYNIKPVWVKPVWFKTNETGYWAVNEIRVEHINIPYNILKILVPYNTFKNSCLYLNKDKEFIFIEKGK